MKIGIVTYHKSHNYGALLQAVALRHYLQMQGYNVNYVDYWPNYHKEMYKLFDKYSFYRRSIKGKICYLLSILITLWRRDKRIRAFESFIRIFILPYCRPYSDNEYFDVIVYGSDQIWRKQERLGNKYNEVYFGTNMLKAKKHVSYAASMGEINITNDDRCFLHETLKKFDGIGVREESLRNLLIDLGFKNAKLNVDPTLLLKREQWDEVINTKNIVGKRYALLYDLHPDSFDKEILMDYCRNNSLELIRLEGNAKLPNRNTYSVDGPETMLSLIAYADIVFTSSFHGLVFSLLYHKDLYASFKTNSDRAKTLMKAVGVERRLINYKDHYTDNVPIDYLFVDSVISKMSNESFSFLSSVLR